MRAGRSILGALVAVVSPFLLCACQDHAAERGSGPPAPQPERKNGPASQAPRPISGALADGTLVRQLRSADESEKRRALEELRDLAPPPGGGARLPDEPMTPVVDALREMIRDQREPLRLEAVTVLGWLSVPGRGGGRTRPVMDALPELSAIATDPGQDEQLRNHAVEAMTFFDAAPALAGVLNDGKAPLQLRLLAANALQYSVAGREQLRRAVETAQLETLVRGAALDAVCESRSPDCAALAGQADPSVRARVAGTMAAAAGGDPRHLAELRSALQDPSRRSQALAAIVALRAIGVPLLVEALEGPDSDLRLMAARSLGGLREAAKDAIPALRRVQETAPEPLERDAAAQALKEIGPPLPDLVAAVATPGPGRRAAFARLSLAVRAMGAQAVEVIPGLRRALKDPDPEARREAISVLGAFGVPRNPESWNDLPVGSPLARFRTAIRDTMPDLIAAFRDPDAIVRERAALAVQGLLPSQEAGAASRPVVQALVDTLDDPDPSVRTVGVQALGSHAASRKLAAADGEEARLVMGALERASRDQSPAVRSMAAQWLTQAKAMSAR